jgi:hypothetical protein
MLPRMATEEWRELEFADGKKAVDQPFAGWIVEATGGNTKSVTFEQAMKMVNNQPMKHILQGVERSVYRTHFRDLGG